MPVSAVATNLRPVTSHPCPTSLSSEILRRSARCKVVGAPNTQGLQRILRGLQFYQRHHLPQRRLRLMLRPHGRTAPVDTRWTLTIGWPTRHPGYRRHAHKPALPATNIQKLLGARELPNTIANIEHRHAERNLQYLSPCRDVWASCHMWCRSRFNHQQC